MLLGRKDGKNQQLSAMSMKNANAILLSRVCLLPPPPHTQSHFGQVYSAEGENMKNLDCPPCFPRVCGPISSGLDLQARAKKIANRPKGGGRPQWSHFFTVVLPLFLGLKLFFSSCKSRPLEHGSSHHGEAWVVKLYHFLTFDWINFAKIGLCQLTNLDGIAIIGIIFFE